MKEILLTKGKVALVDDEDYEWLNQWSWKADRNRKTDKYYATRSSKMVKGVQTCISMHRLIMNISNPKILVDHEDNNGLNNQRRNLRECNYSQNASNRESIKSSSSKYKGVCRRRFIIKGKEYLYWCAQIKKSGIVKFICQKPYSEEGEIMAAKAYDEEAIKYFGEFANVNFR